MSIHDVSSKGSMRNNARVLAQRAVVACCVLATPLTLSNKAHAVPATYTETGFLTGTLNSVGFTDAAVTVTTVADTSNIVSSPFLGGTTIYEVPGTTTIKIDGFNLATFNGGDQFGAVSVTNPSNVLVVVIADLTTLAAILAAPVTGAPYDLSTSATFTAAATNSSSTLSTDAGDLVLTGTSGDATFTATVSNVPEPASAMLFGLGTLALAGIRRRRAG